MEIQLIKSNSRDHARNFLCKTLVLCHKAISSTSVSASSDNSRDFKQSFESLNLFLFWKQQFHRTLINVLFPILLYSYRGWKYMLCSTVKELFFRHFFMNMIFI